MAKYDPFIKCDKCEAIIRKSNKARHMKIKHRETYKGRKLYEKIYCFCNKKFSPNHLKAHWKKFHQDHVNLQHYRWQIKRRMLESGRNFSEFFMELKRRRKLKQKQKQIRPKKVKTQTNIIHVLCDDQNQPILTFISKNQ